MRIYYFLFLFLFISCENGGEFSRAWKSRSKNELIGGIAAMGDVGDYVIENDKIKALILKEGHNLSPALWGGAIVDVDLNRPQIEFLNGKGLDQFYVLLPMANIVVPNPEKGFIKTFNFENKSIIRVVGKSDFVIGLLRVLEEPAVKEIVRSDFIMVTDTILEKGKPYLHIITTLKIPDGEVCDNKLDDDGDGKKDCEDSDCAVMCPDFCKNIKCKDGEKCDELYGECLPLCKDTKDCKNNRECDEILKLCVPEAGKMNPVRKDSNLVDILGGDLLKFISGDVAELKYKPGIVGGDMLLLGAKLKMFCPGIGFDYDRKFREIFLRGRNSLREPLSFDYQIGVGDMVSYGYFNSRGPVLVPFTMESLGYALIYGINCLYDEKDDDLCDNQKFWKYDRYFIVGEGDANSVLKIIYEIKGEKYGWVKGRVIDEKTSEPISKADIFVLDDPCTKCPELCKEKKVFDNYNELSDVAKKCTGTKKDPDGNVGMVSHIQSDVGDDPFLDGDFKGALSKGKYYLVAKKGKLPLSIPALIEIKEDETTTLVLKIPRPGFFAYRVIDEKGEKVPVRVTVGHCFPECHENKDCGEDKICDPYNFQCIKKGGCKSDTDCDIDASCVNGHCECKKEDLAGEEKLELGDKHYSDRVVMVDFSTSGEGTIALPPGHYDVIFARGFEYSIDMKKILILPDHTTMELGVISRVVDTRGWISSDFHVHGFGSPDANVSNEDRIKVASADNLELVSTSDHDFITALEPSIRNTGLWKYVATWPGLEISTLDVGHFLGFPLNYNEKIFNHGAMNWVQKTPDDVFQWVRNNALFGEENYFALVAHPRGGLTCYFDHYNIDPFTFEPVEGFTQKYSPLQQGKYFSNNFDGMEIFNQKRFDIIRMPTVKEVMDFNKDRNSLLKNFASKSYKEISEGFFKISDQHVRKTLMRTKKEQDAFRNFDGTIDCSIPPSCIGIPCKEGKCFEGYWMCFKECIDDFQCEYPQVCWEDGFCFIPPDIPCKSIHSYTDDWLRMLSYGIFKTAFGNSDAHTTTWFEVGCPRNYIKSSSDNPEGFDKFELLNSIRKGKIFPTYGPFIDFSINGKGMGEITEAKKGEKVKIHIRVQSPLWFDVSRVEVYRNENLEFEFDIEIPNKSIINLDKEIDVEIKEDSYFVVFVMGLKGRTLAPVFGSPDLFPVYLGDVFVGIFGGSSFESIIPSMLVFPKIPGVFPQIPYAISNPIFVDVDGEKDGCLITPFRKPLPSWACKADSHRKPCGCD